MIQLIICRGCPGSGKTSWAESWVAEDKENRVNINRDELRKAIYGRYSGLSSEEELNITKIHRESVARQLRKNISVADDSCNLPDKVCKEWMVLAEAAGASFEIKDFRDVPLETCLERNKLRADVGGRRVPEEVIKSMYERQVKGKKLNAPLTPIIKEVLPEYTYVPNTELPKAVLLDIDNTIADHHGVRGPYDEHLVHLDKVHEPIREIINYVGNNITVLAVSGRSRDCYDLTIDWLYDNGIIFDELIMRASGDKRKDSIVKMELFRKYIAPRFNVIAAFDDRNQVVQMYRSIGLTCLQVREGNF